MLDTEFIKKTEDRLNSLRNRQTIFKLLHIIMCAIICFELKKYIIENQIQITTSAIIKLIFLEVVIGLVADSFLKLRYYQSLFVTCCISAHVFAASALMQSPACITRLIGFVYVFMIMLVYITIKTNVDRALEELKNLTEGE